ncbi:SRPBCC family protein [Rufibacter soli]
MASTQQTQERAVRGVLSGLIGLDETVTWQATHFGVRQYLQTRITEFQRPVLFVDEMVTGAFQRFRHEHSFKALNSAATLMEDQFDYTSPFWWLGNLADYLFLQRYMTRLLRKRNQLLKEVAEGNAWDPILKMEKRVLV